MKITHILSGVSLMFLATACVQQPTLEEKLAGKTPEQRKELLLQECKEEAPRGRRTNVLPYKKHVNNMTEICNKMHQEMPPK